MSETMVRSIKMALLLGFLLWLIPFVISFAIYPLHTSDRIFFETLMPITLTLVVVAFSYLYFKDVQAEFLKEGAVIGILWFFISLAIDLLMFTWGPMAMGFTDYMKDIGLTYLIYPIVTIGIGLLLEKRDKRQA